MLFGKILEMSLGSTILESKHVPQKMLSRFMTNDAIHTDNIPNHSTDQANNTFSIVRVQKQKSSNRFASITTTFQLGDRICVYMYD